MAESLGAAVLTVSVDDRQFQAGLNAIRQSAQGTFTRLGQAFAGAGGQSLTSLNIKLNSLREELQGVGIGSKRFRELRNEIEKTQRSLDKANGGAGGVLGGIGTALAGLGAGAAGIAFLRSSINAAVELDTITRKLSNTLGEQGAGRALAFTRSLSDQLGLSFKTLASSFGSFTAAATAANVPLQEQEQLFAAVSKAAQALGLSNDEINGSLLALQQVAAKGTVQMEELRGQLGERLPIAFGATARGLGITQQELIKLVETGQLTASQFFPALTKGLNELTAGAGGTETAAQSFQKLANAWDELQTAFGTSLLPTIVEQVKNLTGALDGLKIGIDANKLGLGGLFGNLGLVPDAGIEAVASVRQLASEYNLTAKQARALFFDAAKLEGLQLTSTGFVPDARGLERTLARLPELAEAFRAKNVDATTELKAQEAEAAKLLALSKKQSEEEQKALNVRLNRAEANLEIKGIQANIAGARDLATLEGTSLVRLQTRLGIEEKLRQERGAQLRLQRELAKPMGDGRGNTQTEESVNKLIAEQEKANANVRLAYAEAGASLSRNAKAAADSLRSAQNNVQSVLRSGFDFLTPALQQQQLAQARAAVTPLISQGIIRQNIDISTPERLLQVASFAESFTNARNDLNNALAENTKAQRALTDKDWTVLVNVPGGSATGDVVREGVYS